MMVTGVETPTMFSPLQCLLCPTSSFSFLCKITVVGEVRIAWELRRKSPETRWRIVKKTPEKREEIACKSPEKCNSYLEKRLNLQKPNRKKTKMAKTKVGDEEIAWRNREEIAWLKIIILTSLTYFDLFAVSNCEHTQTLNLRFSRLILEKSWKLYYFIPFSDSFCLIVFKFSELMLVPYRIFNFLVYNSNYHGLICLVY